MNDIAIKIDNLSKKFSLSLKLSLWYGLQEIAKELLFQNTTNNHLRKSEFWALKDINFEVPKGQMLGLIGLNGAGKSTLLKLINGLFKPNYGKIVINGKISALIELGTGFNPILSGRENIYVNAHILGMSKGEISSNIKKIIEFSELGEFIDAPIKTYSSGMLARLGFSVAIYLNPDILLIDEILSVGDVSFRDKSFNRLMDFKKKGGTIILVSHLSRVIETLCDKAVLLEKGQLVAEGKAAEIVDLYEQKSFSLKNNELLKITENVYNPNDDIHITSTYLYNIKGIQKNEFEYNESILVKFKYKIINIVSTPYFSISLYKNNVHVANLDMRGDGIRITDLPSEGSFSCNIVNPCLSPGNYELFMCVVANISNYLGKKSYMNTKKIASFNILPGKLENKFPGYLKQDLYNYFPPLVLEHKWDLENAKYIQDFIT